MKHLTKFQQVGRVNRHAVQAIEIHVVSNRDRVAHQLFDLWFEQCVAVLILLEIDDQTTKQYSY
jgi:hypothetical protein